MKRLILTLLCIHYTFQVSAFLPGDTLSARPPFLLKAGGYLIADSELDNAGAFSMNLGLEVPLGNHLSLAPGLRIFAGQTVSEMVGEKSAELRYYPEGLRQKGQPISYSGLYLAAAAYMVGKKLPAEGFYPVGSAELNTGRSRNSIMVISPFAGVGAKVGKQISGFLDFGVFAGIENGGEVENAEGRSEAYFYRKVYPEIHSYMVFTLPIAPEGRGFYQNMKLFSVSPFSKRQLFKMGIQDVFSFSGKGLFFNPRVGYEFAFGKWFSVNSEAKLYFERQRRYDPFVSNPLPVWEQQSYLRQQVELLATLQPRFYIPGKSLKQLKDLRGFYAFTELAGLTSSTEQKRQYWEYNKYNVSTFGLGLGFQERLYNHVLIDTYMGFKRRLKNKNDLYYRYSLMAGIEISWAK